MGDESPVCITFRKVVLCPYFSPLILYREIKKVMQNYALSSLQNEDENWNKTRGSVDMTNSNDEEKEEKSYRKPKNMEAEKEQIKKILLENGIDAISSIEFRNQHPELFWNLAWHFSNLRLPIHFLQNAFDENSNEMKTQQIDDLIHYIPLD